MASHFVRSFSATKMEEGGRDGVFVLSQWRIWSCEENNCMFPLKGKWKKKNTNTYLPSLVIKDLQIHYAMNITSGEIYLLFDSAILILAKGKYHTYDQKFMYKVIHLGFVLMI